MLLGVSPLFGKGGSGPQVPTFVAAWRVNDGSSNYYITTYSNLGAVVGDFVIFRCNSNAVQPDNTGWTLLYTNGSSINYLYKVVDSSMLSQYTPSNGRAFAIYRGGITNAAVVIDQANTSSSGFTKNSKHAGLVIFTLNESTSGPGSFVSPSGIVARLTTGSPDGRYLYDLISPGVYASGTSFAANNATFTVIELRSA